MPMKTLKTIFLIFFLLQISEGILFSQNSSAKSNLPEKASNTRSPEELMSLITNFIMKTYELKDGDYAKGDWNTVKKSKPPETLYWSYPTGVCLLAMQRVYNVTHDENILKFIEKNNKISADQYEYLRWQKYKFGTVYSTAGFEKLWRLDMLDDCGAMGAAILETNLRHKVKFTQNLNDLVEIIGNFVTKKQYRLPDGTFWRPNSPDSPTIWADDLYMSLPFLVRWSEYKNDPAALDDAANQIISYASYLQEKDGVWYHAYFMEKKEHTCCRWGRGNGWVAVAEAEVLSVLPKAHPKYGQVLEIYKKHIDGLLKYQSSSGLWNQVIDHPELSWGTETSCSAQFTYAIARGINMGWLGESYIPAAKKALTALSDTTRISARGELLRVGASTSIGPDLAYYNARPVEAEKSYSHGSGLMLFALTEMNTLLRNETASKIK
jgi:unsaturated rhamnogalacturonyl hydrolase